MARNFEPLSRAFLARAAPRGCTRALDLGCGPGHTTRLLRELCVPRELVGLDASEAYVRMAAEASGPRAAFAVHDVTRVPFPGGPADLIHARLLLSHLPEPERALACWRGELRPGGRLLLDEVERIDSQDPVFVRYLELVRNMLRARGQELEIGPRLDAATRSAPRAHDELRELTLPAARAAEMFAPNLAEFRGRPEIREQASESELDALAAGLAARERGEVGLTVTWCMRQLAIEA